MEEAYNVINQEAASVFVFPEQPGDLSGARSKCGRRTVPPRWSLGPTSHSRPLRTDSKVPELGRQHQQGASDGSPR